MLVETVLTTSPLLMPHPAPEVTRLLQCGDRAALDALLPLVYDELRSLARRHLQRESAENALRTTELVHECFLRLVDHERTSWRDRAQFFALASKAMRHLLIDHARSRNALKRGGGVRPLPIEEGQVPTHDRSAELLDLDDALTALARRSPHLEKVVECRFFGGMTIEETATALDRSRRSVERDWTRARVYLHRALCEAAPRQTAP